MNITLTLGGMAALQEKLNRLDDVGTVVGPAIQRGAIRIVNDLSRYPAATAANSPPSGGGPYYKRGTGSVYVRKDGSERVTKSSEQLLQGFRTYSEFTRTLARVRVTTRVSYAQYVYDAQRQASFHRRRGWPTVQALFQKHGPTILQDIEAALTAAISGA